jgi:hypothetical protein
MSSVIGLGGAPTRATTLPTDPAERKRHPVASGVLDYFPDALVAVANVSWQGNEQHNPGQPLHWARSKSTDEADTMLRHFLQRGTRDTDGQRHTAKMVWRALALLQKEIEAEQAPVTIQANEASLRGLWAQGRPPVDDAEREAFDIRVRCCEARNAGYVCTRPRNHDGDHVGAGNASIFTRWEAK